jgi:hypothetical protein
MARANFVQAARKAVPSAGIEVGDSYYWWKFRHGGKRYSKVRPRPSQLTQSEFYSQVYAIQERIEDMSADDSLPDQIDEIASDLRQIGDECRDRRENMPEALQYSPTGELLEERADAMDSAADELEQIDTQIDDDEQLIEQDSEFEPKGDDESDDDFEARKQDRIEELQQEFWDNVLSELQNVSIDAP